MRLIDADELMEHVWRDKLDTRELIAQMITTAPTIKEIPIKIPITIFEQLISQEPKIGYWIEVDTNMFACSNCSHCFCIVPEDNSIKQYNYCPNCGAKMSEPQERRDKE